MWLLRLNQIWFRSFGDWLTGRVVLLLERIRPLKVIPPPMGTQQFTKHSMSNDAYLAKAFRLGCFYQIVLFSFKSSSRGRERRE